MIKAKRWRMVAKQQVELQDYDVDDASLNPREIAVRVDFTAISPGTECANYQALDPDVLLPGKWCTYPWPPGYAGCGHVIAVGSDAKEYKIGDRVVGQMSHASHAVCNVDSDVIPLDPRVNPQHAPYMRLANIAATPLQMLHSDPLPTVGVWGLGMIGNLAAQMLRRAGGRVIGIDPVPERRTLAQECGIQETLDPKAPNFADQIKEMTDGAGLDIAVDTTGHAPTTIGMTQFLRKLGQMVLLTHWRSQAVIDASPFITDLLVKGITLVGAHECAPGQAPSVNYGAAQIRKFKKVQQQLATGDVKVAPLISHIVKPHQCKEAYDGLSFDRAKWWGVVVDWR